MKYIVLCILGAHLTCVSKGELGAKTQNEDLDHSTLITRLSEILSRMQSFSGILSSGPASLGFKLLTGVASQVDLSRVCVVGFSNMGNRKLVNPEWYLSHGVLREPLPREILAGDGGVFTFEKTYCATFGTAGVFTFTIEDSGYQAAVMWDIPMLYGPYSNMFHVRVMDRVTANKQLFNLLRKNETVEVWDSGHWLSRNINDIHVHGAMTNHRKASFLVQLVYNLTEPNA